MRIVIVSRIFTPELSAAPFLLEACAVAFRDAGHEVEVLTTRPPRALQINDPDGVRVRRASVLRDKQGYVRGYLSYLSFDIPAFFRLLLSARADLYLVEPPPTTGAVVRVSSALRRTPYVYDAADLWSDAAAMVTRSTLVLKALRFVEKFAMNGASHAFAISDGLIARMREIGIRTPATAVGFGVDVAAFQFHASPPIVTPVFVYGGSYSEWHGAGIFVEAFARLVQGVPEARMIFVGNGSERAMLEARCAELGLASVEFLDPVPGNDLSHLFSSATASLASLRPSQGYDYAFTTKVYSSLASGCPVLFTGVGPTIDFLEGPAKEYAAGVAVAYDIDAVETAMRAYVEHPLGSAARQRISAWTRSNFSLRAIAERIVEGAEQVVRERRRGVR